MAEDRAHRIGALRDREEDQAQEEPSRRKEAEGGDRESEDRDRDEDPQALPRYASGPSARERDHRGADARRGVEQAESFRPDREDAVREIRHHRSRHREERREEVDRHRREEERS